MPAIKLTGRPPSAGSRGFGKSRTAASLRDFAKMSHLRVTRRWLETSVVPGREKGMVCPRETPAVMLLCWGHPAGTGPGSTSCASKWGACVCMVQDLERH